jgi:hypothetical protein
MSFREGDRTGGEGQKNRNWIRRRREEQKISIKSMLLPVFFTGSVNTYFSLKGLCCINTSLHLFIQEELWFIYKGANQITINSELSLIIRLQQAYRFEHVLPRTP